ncbi:hypothetical protein A2862_01955 [Candidatus Roizmanbacteria bacterium RIFCSPHIGHO2_01_FULL_38_41]|nr:MAG: hypothetical protein A2862_01955 [Candidatus Roizmanbacteria bacterium RIFCSPHIGHO2_01_FULL_38_41]
MKYMEAEIAKLHRRLRRSKLAIYVIIAFVALLTYLLIIVSRELASVQTSDTMAQTGPIKVGQVSPGCLTEELEVNNRTIQAFGHPELCERTYVNGKTHDYEEFFNGILGWSDVKDLDLYIIYIPDQQPRKVKFSLSTVPWLRMNENDPSLFEGMRLGFGLARIVDEKTLERRWEFQYQDNSDYQVVRNLNKGYYVLAVWHFEDIKDISYTVNWDYYSEEGQFGTQSLPSSDVQDVEFEKANPLP